MKIFKWEISKKKFIIIVSSVITALVAGITIPIVAINSGKDKGDTPPPHTHAPTKIEYVAPDCDTAGNNEYYFCDGCDKYFKDAECKTETTVAAETLAKTGHDFTGEWERDKDGHWHICQNDGCGQADGKEGHTSSGAATETEPETCTACNYVINPELNHVHNYTEKIEDEAHLKTTTDCRYYNEYWYDCAGCNTNAKDDAEASDQYFVSESKKGDHLYDETAWGYKDKNGHAHNCQYCDAHDSVQPHIAGEPATEENAQICTECEYELDPILPHTHTYGEVSYVWNADNTVCTATRVCTKDENHVETEDGAVATESTGDCSTGITTTYTATFANTAFTTQTKTETISADEIEHTYGDPTVEWNADYTDCTVTRVCSTGNHTDDTLTKSIETASDGAKTVTVYDGNGTKIAFFVYKQKTSGDGYYLYKSEIRGANQILCQTFDESGTLLGSAVRLIFEGYAPDSDDSEFFS